MNANNSATEKSTKRLPKTILCCFVIAQDLSIADFESLFSFGVAFFIVLAILVCTINYKNFGK
jgi:hypothetical protein